MSLAQERRISELATMAEILRDCGLSESTLYQDVLTEWTKAFREGVESCVPK